MYFNHVEKWFFIQGCCLKISSIKKIISMKSSIKFYAKNRYLSFKDFWKIYFLIEPKSCWFWFYTKIMFVRVCLKTMGGPLGIEQARTEQIITCVQAHQQRFKCSARRAGTTFLGFPPPLLHVRTSFLYH